MLLSRFGRATALVITLLVLAGVAASAATMDTPNATVPSSAGDDAFTLDLTWNAVYGTVDVGATVTVSRTVGGGAYGAARADGTGFFWTHLYNADRSGTPAFFAAGDILAVSVEGSVAATLPVRAVTGQVNVVSDTVSATITGLSAGTPVTVTLGRGYEGQMIASQPRATATVDASGAFAADFSGAVDIDPTMMAQVEYAEGTNGTVRFYVYPSEVFAVSNGAVQGYAQMGDLLDVTVYETYPTDVRSTDTAFAEWPYGWYSVVPDLEPGDVVEVDLPGGKSLRLDTFNLEMYPDVETDTVTGLAPAGRSVHAYVWSDVDDAYGQAITQATPSGTYDLSLPVDLETRHEVHVGCADADGDELLIVERPPHIRAYPHYLGLHAVAPRPNVPVTYTLPAHDFVFHGFCGQHNDCAWASVGEPLIPGEIITASFPGLSMAMEVAEVYAYADPANDSVTGSVDRTGFLKTVVQEWHGERYPTNGWDSAGMPVPSGPYALPIDNDLRNGVRLIYAHFYGVDGHKTTVLAGSPFYGTPHLQVHVPHAASGVGPWDDPITASLYDTDGTLLAQAEDSDPDPWRFWIDGWPGNWLTAGRWLTVTSESGWSTGLEIPTMTLYVDGVDVWGRAPEPMSLIIEHPTAWGEEGQFVPTLGTNYYLDVAAIGGEVEPRDEVRAIYLTPDGNRVQQEVIAAVLPRVEFWMEEDCTTDMWGVAFPGALVTITTPLTQVTGYADPGAGGNWAASPGRVYPGDQVTVTIGTENPHSQTILIPDPLSAEASAESDEVWGQIGGWNGETVEIHGAWEGGYQEVITDLLGRYRASYADIPEGTSGYVRWVDALDETNVIFHRSFETPGPVRVGYVSDGPTLEGSTFTWDGYQGLLRAETDLSVSGTVYTSTDSAQYEPNLHQCVDDGNQLCLSIGFAMANATRNAAAAHPDTCFAAVDVSWASYPDNLRGMIFASDEAGYMAGTLAGLMTESNVVGAVGGMPIPAVDSFLYGYRNGAQCVNPRLSALITYTHDFSDPDLGAEFAQDLIAKDADVIFAPAGPTGTGAVLTATQSGIWGIGVDSDYYETVFDDGAVDGSENLLTSAMKRIDNAVYHTIQDVVSDTFTSGTLVYDLEVDGVGLAPFHEAAPHLDEDVRDQLDLVRQGIIDGSIDLCDSCRRFVYLPVVVRGE